VGWCVLAFMFCTPFASASVVISEVLADPIADESLNEWIELYNNGTEAVDLQGWLLGDDTGNDTLEGGQYNGEGTVIPAFGFAMVTDDATRVYNNFNASPAVVKLYVDDSALGNGLKNSGETIYLYSGDELIDTADYPAVAGGSSALLVNGTWQEGIPTPGYPNDGIEIPKEEFPIISPFCDYRTEIITETSFIDEKNVEWKMVATNEYGPKTNLTGRVYLTDLNGKLIKEYKPWTNQSITTKRTSSTYTPNLKKGNTYVLVGNISVGCNDTNKNNDKDFRIFSIPADELSESLLEFITILDLGSDKRARFGQSIRSRVSIYKGNTTKNSVALWIEDRKGKRLSKQSKINVETKFSVNEFTVPLQIIPNCNEKFDDDTYTLVIEGLDVHQEKDIKIADLTSSLCSNADEDSSSKKSSRKKITFEVVNIPPYVHGKESTATVRLWNNEDVEQKIELWSYLYRKSVSYSGMRERNKVMFIVPEQSITDVELKNTPRIEEEGMYKIKFLMKREDRKTADQITMDISIANPIKKTVTEMVRVSSSGQDPITLEGQQAAVNRALPLIVPETLFISPAERTKEFVPLLIILLSAVLNIILILRR